VWSAGGRAGIGLTAHLRRTSLAGVAGVRSNAADRTDPLTPCPPPTARRRHRAGPIPRP